MYTFCVVKELRKNVWKFEISSPHTIHILQTFFLRSYLASTIQEVIHCSSYLVNFWYWNREYSQEWKIFYDQRRHRSITARHQLPSNEFRRGNFADFRRFSDGKFRSVRVSWDKKANKIAQIATHSVASFDRTTIRQSTKPQKIFITFAICDCNAAESAIGFDSIPEMPFICAFRWRVEFAILLASISLPRESIVCFWSYYRLLRSLFSFVHLFCSTTHCSRVARAVCNRLRSFSPQLHFCALLRKKNASSEISDER